MNIHELDSYDLGDAVKFNDKLNPRIWGADEKMRPEVREQLLRIADDFREFLGIDVDIEDITVSGSNAAYTYTPHSDIDLHLVVDLPEADRSEVYRELFDAKKYAYNDQHNIKIGGYDVELYVQDANKTHHSQGIYSIKNDDWVSVPKRRRPDVDDISVKSKFEDLGHRIEAAIRSGDYERISELATKLKDYRQAGLDAHGEFGPENLAFKILRTQGLIKKLYDARNAAKDRLLSLDERKKKKKKVRYGYGGYWYPGTAYAGQDHPAGSEGGDAGGDGGESIREDAGMTWDGVNPTTDMFTSEDATMTWDGVNPTTAMFTTETQDPTDEEILRDFVDFCVKELKIKSMPRVKLRRDPQWPAVHKTFGRYNDESKTLEVAWGQRHIMDVLRTVAHELTHKHQHEREGERMGPDAGETGSPYENEANARAGVLMRDYGRLHPEYFSVGQAHDLEESASGYIPTKAQAKDPRFSMALTVDVKPGQVGKEANKLKLRTDKQGHPQIARANGLFENLYREYKQYKADEDYDPDHPPGPEFKPTMPAGTLRVDVSDVYDWYKLGQHISNMKGLGKHDFGAGPPSTIIGFGSEDEEHKFIKDLEATGLDVTDIDPASAKKPPGRKIKTDLTYNVDEAIQTPVSKEQKAADDYYRFIVGKIRLGRVLNRQEQEFFKTYNLKKKLAEFAPSPGYGGDGDDDDVPRYLVQYANAWWNAADPKEQKYIEDQMATGGWTIRQIDDDTVLLNHKEYGITYRIRDDQFDPDLYEDLNELAFKSTLPVTQTMDHPRKQVYDLKTQSGEYQIVLDISNKDENFDDDPDYDGPTGYILDIYFVGRKSDGGWTQWNTNVGEKQVAQIYSTIAQLAVKIIKAHPEIDEIEIKGADPQRSRIYSRLIQQNVNTMLPGWKLGGAGLVREKPQQAVAESAADHVRMVMSRAADIMKQRGFRAVGQLSDADLDRIAKDTDATRHDVDIILNIDHEHERVPAEARFPGAPDVKMPGKQTQAEAKYNQLHRQLKQLADTGEIDTAKGKQQAAGIIDAIQNLVNTQLPGNPVPSKKIWLNETHLAKEDTASYPKVLYHGSTQEIKGPLTPRQAHDIGGAPGSNKNAIYATDDPNFAIAYSLAERGSDTGTFGWKKEPRLIFFGGRIRRGQNVYIHVLPTRDEQGRPLFTKGDADAEWYSLPGVEEIMPIKVITKPVDQYLHLLRKPTPAEQKIFQANKTKQPQAVTEGADDEAWELVGSTLPEIKKFTTGLGLENNETSVAEITPIIATLPDQQISPEVIPKLKNLTSDHIVPGHDANILKGIIKISGRPDARKQYVSLMNMRDQQEVNMPGRQARQRGYDLGNLFDAVKSGKYESPVLLKLPTGVYVIGGRTRLYAALALNMPIRVKILTPASFAKQTVKEDEDLDEVKMSPGALEKFATSPEAKGIRAGFEAELIFRDTQGESEELDPEPNYDADERCYSIQQVIDFFSNDEYGYGLSDRAQSRLMDDLDESYMNWRDEKIKEEFRNEAEDLIRDKLLEETPMSERIQIYLTDSEQMSDEQADRIVKAGADAPRFKTSAEQQAYADQNPEYKAYLDAADAAEEELDESVEYSVNKQDGYWDEALDDFRDNWSGDDDSFFSDVGLRWMSDVANEYNLDWPVWDGGEQQNYGSRGWEDIGNSLQDAVDMPVVVSSNYHTTKRRPGQWIIEPDGSLDPDDKSEEAGLEIVSPPMPLLTAIEKLKSVVDWANDPNGGNAYTNSSTGLHMGVSLPTMKSEAAGEDIGIDYVKLILFMGDKYVQQQFGREANTYCASALEKLKQNIRGKKSDPAGVVKLLQHGLTELAHRELQKGVGTSKYTSAHIQPGYIEFRSPGGDWLAKADEEIGVLENTMLRFARAMAIAGDPNAERQEYAKKLYKLVTTDNPEYADQLRLFSEFSAGTINKEQLKKQWADTVLQKELPSVGKNEYEVYSRDNDNSPDATVATLYARDYDDAYDQFLRKYGRDINNLDVRVKQPWFDVFDDKGKIVKTIRARDIDTATDRAQYEFGERWTDSWNIYRRPDDTPEPKASPRAQVAKRIATKPKAPLDYNYDIIDQRTLDLKAIDRFYAANDQEASRVFDQWLRMKNLPNDTANYGYRRSAKTVSDDQASDWEAVHEPTGRVLDTLAHADAEQAVTWRDSVMRNHGITNYSNIIVRRVGHQQAADARRDSVDLQRNLGVQDVDIDVTQNFSSDRENYELYQHDDPTRIIHRMPYATAEEVRAWIAQQEREGMPPGFLRARIPESIDPVSGAGAVSPRLDPKNTSKKTVEPVEKAFSQPVKSGLYKSAIGQAISQRDLENMTSQIQMARRLGDSVMEMEDTPPEVLKALDQAAQKNGYKNWADVKANPRSDSAVMTVAKLANAILRTSVPHHEKVFYKSKTDENFADKKVKGKSRPGRVKRAGASCKGSITDLRARAKKYGGEKGKMYHWCANMKSGRKK